MNLIVRIAKGMSNGVRLYRSALHAHNTLSFDIPKNGIGFINNKFDVRPIFDIEIGIKRVW